MIVRLYREVVILYLSSDPGLLPSSYSIQSRGFSVFDDTRLESFYFAFPTYQVLVQSEIWEKNTPH